MSRPEKKINWHDVDAYLEAGCLGSEIAAQFDMHPHTFYDRVVKKYNMTFTDYCSEKRNKGAGLIRKKQFDKALEGDNSMLIWLGKNRLKQSDSPFDQNVTEEVKNNFNALMDQVRSFQNAMTEEKSRNSNNKS